MTPEFRGVWGGGGAAIASDYAWLILCRDSRDLYFIKTFYFFFFLINVRTAACVRKDNLWWIDFVIENHIVFFFHLLLLLLLLLSQRSDLSSKVERCIFKL